MRSSFWWIRSTRCRCRRRPIACRWRATRASRFPSLARSDRFDSAIFGTSTSRLLRPAVLNAEFGARFANLSMNAATAYEQSRLMAVFRTAHPAARMVLVGLDISYCTPGETEEIHAARISGVDVRWRPVARLSRDVQPVCGAGGRPGVRHPDRHQATGLWQRRLHQLRPARQRIRPRSRCDASARRSAIRAVGRAAAILRRGAIRRSIAWTRTCQH